MLDLVTGYSSVVCASPNEYVLHIYIYLQGSLSSGLWAVAGMVTNKGEKGMKVAIKVHGLILSLSYLEGGKKT